MITAITVQCVIEIRRFGRLTCEKNHIVAKGPILSGTQLSNFALIQCNEHLVGCAQPLLQHKQCKCGANSFLCCSIFLGSVKDGPAVTDRTCCHVKLQFTFKWPYKKLHKSPWLHLWWTVMDQIKANAILAVLRCGTPHRQIILGLGSNYHLAEAMYKTTANVKTGPEASPHIFNPDGSWQSEGTVNDGAFSTSTFDRSRPSVFLGPCFSQAHHWVQYGDNCETDSWYSQNKWDNVKSPSGYELWIEETQIVYGYPRYLNGHLRLQVP